MISRDTQESFPYSLQNDIRRLSYEQEGRLILSIEATHSLAATHAFSPRAIEALALQEHIVPCRYLKNLDALRVNEQQSLLQSKVALVGLGGLGGYVLELMARAGIGTITAADGDVFDQSNLNRQLFAREDNLRQSKAQAAQTRLRQINTSVDFQVWNVFLQVEDYTDFLENQNLVVDALGGLDVRRDLLHQAAIMGVPLVTGAVAGEMGYVSTVYPGENGPLELWQGQSGAEESLGCLDYGVSLVASLQCAEVIHILAGRAASLRGRLLVCDLKDFSWQVFDL